MVARKPFTEVLFHEGTISTLYGLPGSGKTNLMVFLSEMGAKHGFNMFSIIHYFDAEDIIRAKEQGLLPEGVKYKPVPNNVKTIKRVSDLLLGVLENDRNVVILDEAGVFASTRNPMAKKLRYILNLSYIIRHLRSSFIYVTQTDRSIPPEMRESLVKYEMNIRKHDNNSRVLTIKKRKEYYDRNGNEHINFIPIDVIGRVPLTRLPWDGHFIPKFDFDIDLDETWNLLGEYNSLEVQDVGIDIIKEQIKNTQEMEEEKNKDRAEESRDKRAEAIDWFREEKEVRNFGSKSKAAGALAKEFDMSFSWAYQIINSIGLD